jgi:RNA polymerase sigma-70 factor, ECF subfamily
MTTTETAMPTRFLPWAAATEADWDALYSEQLPRVYNFFRYRIGDGPEAEDLTADTFERAWRARHRYRRELAGFTTWLFTIAQRVAIDHHRRRRTHLPLEAAEGIAAGPTPEDLAVARSDGEKLARLLERLPARERELVALKYGAELTNRAIARVSGLSESNVGTILHRAVQGLRAEWFAEEGGAR